MALLRAAIADAPFVFVVGKGGVGKTTIAAALALELVDDGAIVQLLSTDPAHSLRDVLSDPPSAVTIDEFDAHTYANTWLARTRGAFTELIESGTYLDEQDVDAFTQLTLPGIDELMAALRLVDLAPSGRRVIVDTAPTGHTLRLLDAANTYEGIARALSAMADKAAVVASSMMGRAVRLRGEELIDELHSYAQRFNRDVLQAAQFIIAARPDDVVVAETTRLRSELRQRSLHVAATVWTGGAPADVPQPCLIAPLQPQPPRGAVALRGWSRALTHCTSAADAVRTRALPATTTGGDALPWLRAQSLRLWVFAGKGGVGKSTCAAACAVALAAERDVLLCSADPAGSLADLLPDAHNVARLRVRQIEPTTELERLRELYRDQVLGAFESFGVADAAVLDRRVIESLWELAPPGIDEIAALITLLDVADDNAVIVLDTAPTGHFLRLLEMPDIARDWTRQLMRMLVKYGGAGTDNGAGEALLRLARELRALHTLLHDPARTGIIVITLAENVVQAETRRLLAQLSAQQLPVKATLVNRAPQQVHAVDHATITAPLLSDPPVGAAALREFAATWKIVA